MTTSTVTKNKYVWGFVVGAVLLGLLRFLQEFTYRAPPPLINVPAWQLTSHTGAPFGSAELKGKVWVGSFFFTRCPSICPKLMATMKEVQKSLGENDDFHIVSFSVDPENDTPTVLQNYVDATAIDTRNWTLVTGEKESIRDVLVEKMKIHVGEREYKDVQSELYDISHLGKIGLFDQNGDLRHLADTDPTSLGMLGNAARLLARKGPNP